MIHKGVEFEKQYEKDKTLPDPDTVDTPDLKCL